MQLTLQRVPAMRPSIYIVIVAILLAALVGAALFVASRPRLPDPFGPAGNGALVFDSGVSLLIVDELGGASRQLTIGQKPVFSSQGNRIAFLRPGAGDRLFSVRPDGSDLRELAGPFGSLDGFGWSTNGSAIIIGYRDGPYTPGRLSIVSADGSKARNLDVGMSADLASWRPGGSQIVFRGSPSGTTAKGVFVVNADGTDLERLELPVGRDPASGYEGLAWSPDGSRLSWMDYEGLAGADRWRTSVADVDPAGRVTSVREGTFSPGSASEFAPVWSPDSDRLSFILESDGTRQVAVASVSGTGEVTPIGPSTPLDNSEFGHTWSPDGGTVLIRVVREVDASADGGWTGEQEFWSVDVATRAERRLDWEFASALPSWQRTVP